MDQIIENDAGDKDTEKEAKDANELRDKLILAKISLKALQAKVSKKEHKEDVTREISSEKECSGQANICHKAKLPKLQLTKFSGTVAQW